jgi:chromosomal replication initiation ATPase DnaA
MGEKISLALAKKLIPSAKEISIEHQSSPGNLTHTFDRSEDDVIQHVCNALRLSVKDIKSGRRDQRVIKGRQYIVYILTEDFGMSLSQIGQFLGRSHSTIHNALKNAQKSMEIDDVYRRQVIAIRKGINSSNNQGLTLPTSQSSEETLFNFSDLGLKTGSI